MKYLLLLLSIPLLASAQAPATPPSGVSAAWDISKTLESLSAQTARLKPVLDRITVQDWVNKGAPSAYAEQWRGAQDEVGYLIDAAAAFRKQPEKLSLALNTYFRLMQMDQQLRSAVEGVQRYQDPAVGNLLLSVLAENGPNRDALRQYISDLAVTKEQEFQIVDSEAQRCRTELLRQQPPPARTAPAQKKREPAQAAPSVPEPKK